MGSGEDYVSDVVHLLLASTAAVAREGAVARSHHGRNTVGQTQLAMKCVSHSPESPTSLIPNSLRHV